MKWLIIIYWIDYTRRLSRCQQLFKTILVLRLNPVSQPFQEKSFDSTLFWLYSIVRWQVALYWYFFFHAFTWRKTVTQKANRGFEGHFMCINLTKQKPQFQVVKTTQKYNAFLSYLLNSYNFYRNIKIYFYTFWEIFYTWFKFIWCALATLCYVYETYLSSSSMCNILLKPSGLTRTENIS